MTDLLSSVIAAHGGLDRWRTVRAKVQQLYFGDDFMLRRLDYVTDVLGGVAAHYCYDNVTTDGLVFPTLRRVVRRARFRRELHGEPYVSPPAYY